MLNPTEPKSGSSQETEPPREPPAQSHANTSAPLAPEDFYYEGSNLVFTAAYHRKRGYCCNSGCRHCPFNEPAAED